MGLGATVIQLHGGLKPHFQNSNLHKIEKTSLIPKKKRDREERKEREREPWGLSEDG